MCCYSILLIVQLIKVYLFNKNNVKFGLRENFILPYKPINRDKFLEKQVVITQYFMIFQVRLG